MIRTQSTRKVAPQKSRGIDLFRLLVCSLIGLIVLAFLLPLPGWLIWQLATTTREECWPYALGLGCWVLAVSEVRKR